MANQELLDYIKGQIEEGTNKEVIKNALVQNGWTSEDVEEAFSIIYPESQTIPASSLTAQEDVIIDDSETQNEIAIDETNESSEDNLFVSDKYKARHSSASKSRVGLFFAVIIGLIIISAAGVLAYNKFFNKLTPYDVVVQMVSTDSSSVTTSKFSGDIDFRLDIKDNNKESIAKMNTAVELRGDMDLTDKENISLDIQNKLDFSGSYSFFSVAFKAGWDIRLKDSVVYIRLNELTNIPGFNFGAIKDRWISLVDVSDGVSGIAGQFDTSNILSVDFNDDEELEKNAEINRKFKLKYVEFVKSDEVKEIVNRSFVDGEDKKMDGVSVYHYVISFNKEDIKTILTKTIDILVEVLDEDDEDLKEIEEFMESEEFETLLDILVNSNMGIWIGKEDFLTHKTFINTKFLDEKFPDPFAGAGLNSAREKGNQASIKANFSSIRVQAELYYDDEGNNSYGNVTDLGICSINNISSNTMFSFAKNVVVSIESIRELNGNDVHCVATGNGAKAQKYAMSAPFKDGSASWCIDSSGFAGSGQASEDGTCKDDYIPTEVNVKKGEISIGGGMTITYSTSGHNEPVNIKAPENIITIEDATKAIYGIEEEIIINN